MFDYIQLLDGLHMYQEHDFDLPSMGGLWHRIYDQITGEIRIDKEEPHTYEGSHTTSIKINISGRRLSITRGNPSKINRLDNLFGYKTIDECVFAYNQILLSLGLPPFTKCTKIWHCQSEDGSRAIAHTDGAVITEIHTTSNKSVGQGNVSDYLRGLSTQRLRNSVPHLLANGCTVQWLPAKRELSNTESTSGLLIHSCVYDKANEIALHQLPKIKRHYGLDSPEYQELFRVYLYCLEMGVVRFENKHKSRSLKRQNLQYYGLSDYSKLDQLQKDFIEIDKKLSVNAMTMQTISELLKEEGVCQSTQAANATAGYYFMWLQGQKFDLHKKQVQTHRARLRRINIDIAESCDITKHSAIRIKEVREITVQELAIPEWYKMPNPSHLSLVS